MQGSVLLIERFKSSEAPIDLVLLDLSMPRVDGWETLNKPRWPTCSRRSKPRSSRPRKRAMLTQWSDIRKDVNTA